MHSHLDLSSAQEDVWMLLRSHVEQYDARDLRVADASRGTTSRSASTSCQPAIDPNSARNMPLPDEVVRSVLEQYGIDPDAADGLPGLAVRRRERPRRRRRCLGARRASATRTCSCACVLTTEPHDPQSRACYDELARRTHDEPDAFIVIAGTRDRATWSSTCSSAPASVVMQKGLRKGFGLWVSDALWKQRPCVVAPAGGLAEQVIDGETGLIASTTDEFADARSRDCSTIRHWREIGETRTPARCGTLPDHPIPTRLPA